MDSTLATAPEALDDISPAELPSLPDGATWVESEQLDLFRVQHEIMTRVGRLRRTAELMYLWLLTQAQWRTIDTVASLATRFGVTARTIQFSWRQLEAHGLVARTERVGLSSVYAVADGFRSAVLRVVGGTASRAIRVSPLPNRIGGVTGHLDAPHPGLLTGANAEITTPSSTPERGDHPPLPSPPPSTRTRYNTLPNEIPDKHNPPSSRGGKRAHARDTAPLTPPEDWQERVELAERHGIALAYVAEDLVGEQLEPLRRLQAMPREDFEGAVQYYRPRDQRQARLLRSNAVLRIRELFKAAGDWRAAVAERKASSTSLAVAPEPPTVAVVNPSRPSPPSRALPLATEHDLVGPVLAIVATKVPAATFARWLAPLRVAEVSEGRWSLFLEDEFDARFCEKQFGRILEANAAGLGLTVAVEVVHTTGRLAA